VYFKNITEEHRKKQLRIQIPPLLACMLDSCDAIMPLMFV